MGRLLDAFANADLFSATVHRDNEAYREAEQDLQNSQKKMYDILDGEGRELLEEHICNINQLLFLSGGDHSKYGFRLGVLMMAEVFAEKERMIEDAQLL